MDRAALQVADQASTDASAFGQLLLGQVTGKAQALEIVAEGQERGLSSRVFAGSHDVSLCARSTPDKRHSIVSRRLPLNTESCAQFCE
jgi:hypothetical protein